MKMLSIAAAMTLSLMNLQAFAGTCTQELSELDRPNIYLIEKHIPNIFAVKASNDRMMNLQRALVNLLADPNLQRNERIQVLRTASGRAHEEGIKIQSLALEIFISKDLHTEIAKKATACVGTSQKSECLPATENTVNFQLKALNESINYFQNTANKISEYSYMLTNISDDILRGYDYDPKLLDMAGEILTEIKIGIPEENDHSASYMRNWLSIKESAMSCLSNI